MKQIAFNLFLLCLTITLFCSCESKNYSVDVSDGIVEVKMHSPTMGIVGINEVGYDGTPVTVSTHIANAFPWNHKY